MLGLHTDIIHTCTVTSVQVLGVWALVWGYTQTPFTGVTLYSCRFWGSEHYSEVTRRHHSQEYPYIMQVLGVWALVALVWGNTPAPFTGVPLHSCRFWRSERRSSYLFDKHLSTDSFPSPGAASVWSKFYYSRVGREKLVNGRKCKTFEWGKGNRDLEMRKRLGWPGAGPAF